MSSHHPAIHVRYPGKKYHLGGSKKSYHTLRDAIVNSVKAPFHRIIHKNSDQFVNEFWALKDVSFNMELGEVVGIIGWNGAGKSTLLKILSWITTLSEGLVELHQRVGIRDGLQQYIELISETNISIR